MGAVNLLRRASPLIAILACWGLATSAPLLGPWVSVPASTLAVLVIPGWLIDRQLLRGGPRPARAVEWPARVLALSVAVVASLSLICSLSELNMAGLLRLLFSGCCVLSVLGPASSRGDLAQTAEPVQPELPESSSPALLQSGGSGKRASFLLSLLVAATAVATAMAAAGGYVARDRMWYLAYVAQLGNGEPIGWGEPFFNTGVLLARFAYNAWITSLAAWTALAAVRGAVLFEKIAPVLLTPAVVSASFALGRAVLGTTSRAATAALASLLVLLSTRYPFFSPGHYPFFGRLAEDKTVALLVFMPLAISLVIELLEHKLRPPLVATVAVGLVLLATALSHAIVYLILLISTLPFILVSYPRGRGSRTAVFQAIVLILIMALPPAWLGLQATRGTTSVRPPDAVAELDASHPVLRSHLRMNRLVATEFGGPVVDVRLFSDPLLVVGLVGGLLVAWRNRRRRWAHYLLCVSAICLALAFTPWLSPLFGKLILPWMVYRVLWGLPFGLLLAAVMLELPGMLAMPGSNHRGPSSVLVVLICLISVPAIPWGRLGAAAGTSRPSRLEPDPLTLELLDAISELPTWSVIATGQGLAELIPAYTGRAVLAFSDRGSVVFAGSRDEGEKRLRANAALVGLWGEATGLRNRLAASYGVTHVVYERRGCDRHAAPVFTNPRYSLCVERSRRRGHKDLSRITAVGSPDAEGPILASLGTGFRCSPPFETTEAGERTLHGWKRDWRWSANPVVVRCRSELGEPSHTAVLRIVPHLPKAHEVLVYSLRLQTVDGKTKKRQGSIEFRGNPNGEIRVSAEGVTDVDVTLVASYLPYLNLEALELRGP